MARRTIRGGALPHTRYGVNLSTVPDTYIAPFTAYRVWNWTAEGLTSLNREPWTAKVAFEAKCHYADDLRSMKATAPNTKAAQEFWSKHNHHVPDPNCTCGMYAGINMQHLIDINYIQRGIHGEVDLWGRLYRHTLGWRAQYAYPKNFFVPVNMVPVKVEEAQRRLAALVEFGVEVHLQPEREARVGQQTIPLWMSDYGYTTQGTEFLIDRWKRWSTTKIVHALAVGDRLAVLSNVNGGIGVVKEINDDNAYFTMFAPDAVYHKKVKEIVWNERNWRWETNGAGSMRTSERKATTRSVLR